MRALRIPVVCFLFVVIFAFGIAYAATMSEAIMAKFTEVEQQYQLPPGILAKIAKIESGGNARALNSSSQAGGLFQWIPRYWVQVAPRAIPNAPGIANPENRFNPFLASEVSAYNLRYIRNIIAGNVQQAGADLSVGLYMGHFLGPAGANRFFAEMIRNREANAAQLFPTEARANPTIFNGRTIVGVYNLMAQKMQTSGITGVSNYDGTYTGPMTSRIMDAAGNAALLRLYTVPPSMLSGQDPYRSYPSTYNQQQDSNTTTNPLQPTTQSPAGGTGTNAGVVFPPAAIVITQESVVKMGGIVRISWTSVGMSTTNPCKVSRGGVEIKSANQGTMEYTVTDTSAGTAEFNLQCASVSGESVSRSTNVTLVQ
jgi:hypothetical protein